MKKICAMLLFGLLLALCGMAAAEYSPGTLMEPPAEVREHIASRWPDYALEDYCEIEDTPKGDYGFALLTKGRTRMLVGYHREDGKMAYWLKNEGAVPQGSEEAWFSVLEQGTSYYNSRKDRAETAEGWGFGVTRLDNSGESYAQSVSYRWADGGFRLEGYTDSTIYSCYIEDGYLEFWDWSTWEKLGRVYGEVQTDIRYVSYGALPKRIEEAREKIAVAPQGLVIGEFEPKEIEFTGGQKYPVYLGPGEAYARSGDGKGQVSTNGWIQVFGEYDGQIMIQYSISADRFRIGWIDASALPKGASVPQLAFDNLTQTIMEDCALTDDPISSQTQIGRLKAGTQVISLADFAEFFYIEVELNGETVWGFVPADAISKG